VSYILDALKKAEADRNPDARTTLAIEQRDRRRHRALIYVAITALIANGMIILWLFVPDADQPDAAHQPVMPATTAIPAAATPVQDSDTGPPARLPDSAPARIDESASSNTTLTEPSPTTLAGMPQSARRRFPSLSFSTHVYASDPGLRAIVVNGTRLTEGDALGALVVHEITEEGAVFSFDSYLVSIPVLEDWN
jgi:general secretion pathway protein B